MANSAITCNQVWVYIKRGARHFRDLLYGRDESLYYGHSYKFLIFYYTKGTLTWWLKAFNPLIMALLHKFWSLENSMACPLSAKSNNNQTCYYWTDQYRHKVHVQHGQYINELETL